MIGTSIGSYQIVAKLGEGGMGEVYRATDTKLKRQVAIKILPASVATDHVRLVRFQREAEVLASLNHPNIAAIYGLEDGQEGREGKTLAIVMELVEGEDLAQRIGRGRVPVDEALAMAKQIVDALEAAHEQGIIHRDLKPANIKATENGTVKVLDFGLAKAVDAKPSSVAADATNLPTITSPATHVGVILGTAAYMAPEQARGRGVDKRADIWAFGVVLYEMLTGRRAFDGEDVTEVLGAVVRLEPDFDALPPDVPARVRRVLQLCLKKDVRQRAQAIGDVRLALEGAFETDTPVRTVAEAPARSSRLGWIVAAALGLVAAAFAMTTARHLAERAPDVRVLNTTLTPPEGGEFGFASPYAIPAVSPDGTRVVFGAKVNGRTQLWLRRLDSAVAQPLAGTEDAGTPFWSPDSRWIAFGQGLKLKKIDIQGGPPVSITDIAGPLRGGSWNADGVILFGTNIGVATIARVSAAGGVATPAIPAEKDLNSQQSPWFLPDGRHFLYILSRWGDMPLAVASIDEPDTPGKVVAQVHSSAAYADGHLLYLRESTLMAQPFDVNQLRTTGQAVAVAEAVTTFTSPSRLPGFSVSPAGLIVIVAGSPALGSGQLLWKDRQGKVTGTLNQGTEVGTLEHSPDGKREAATVTERGRAQDIWIFDVARGIRSRFTFDPNADRAPLWSPDSHWVYFASNRGKSYGIFRKASDGGGTEELVFSDGSGVTPGSITPDGKLMLYQRASAGNVDIFVLPLTAPPGGKIEPYAFLQTPSILEGNARISPDGHWVVYVSNESGRDEVYAAAFPGPGGKRQVSASGGVIPRWRADGKEIFFSSPEGQLRAVEITVKSGTLEIGAQQKLFDGIITARGTTYDTLDGQTFLVVDDGVPTTRPLTLIQNWTAALHK